MQSKLWSQRFETWSDRVDESRVDWKGQDCERIDRYRTKNTHLTKEGRNSRRKESLQENYCKEVNHVWIKEVDQSCIAITKTDAKRLESCPSCLSKENTIRNLKVHPPEFPKK